MKINNIIVAITAALFLLTACNGDEFLDKKPLSDITDEGFFTAPNQLEAYANAKYGVFPQHEGYGFGLFENDGNSDNNAGRSANTNFVPQQRTVPQSGSYGFAGNMRDINRFLKYTAENLKNGTLSNTTQVQQYIGEMYFFRAYIYFNNLKTYGDFPIVTEPLADGDYAANVEASKRKPRNEVARFILNDLDSAIAKIQPKGNAISNWRLNRQSAQLFKSRVALYEASWETYHKGTTRVPGGPGYPGTFSGNLDTEISFFLTQAMDAAKAVADNVPLYAEYEKMFNSRDLSSMNEVVLWRRYSADAKVQNNTEGAFHTIGNKGGVGGVALTRSLVDSYLMKNGLPIYAAGSGYEGDANLTKVTNNRDNRLVLSMYKPGDKIWKDAYMSHVSFTQADAGIHSTGYVNRKGWADTDIAPNSNSPLANVIFRAAEAYLNHIEADYMKNGSLNADSKKYWEALRTRAKVDTDFQKTINATDLSKEQDLAKYSGSSLVDATLYNIRRERRSEFISEGMRLDDLYRWRSLDMMKNYKPQGSNFWTEVKDLYSAATTGTPDVIPFDGTNPYLFPLWTDALAKDGYNFEEANYLSPISYDVFRLSTPEKGGDVSTSVVYQNPGWPVEINGKAIR